MQHVSFTQIKGICLMVLLTLTLSHFKPAKAEENNRWYGGTWFVNYIQLDGDEVHVGMQIDARQGSRIVGCITYPTQEKPLKRITGDITAQKAPYVVAKLDNGNEIEIHKSGANVKVYYNGGNSRLLLKPGKMPKGC